ncbi:MAG: N-acetylglucosamine-6-phosphate deacetylase [Planctomycetota bacterium]
MVIIHNGTAILPDRLLPNAVVCYSGPRITRVATRNQADRRAAREATTIDAEGGYITPGFIDLHVHGGAGADFMDGTVEAIRTACDAHARHGTTTIFPTTTTGSPASIQAMIAACAAARRQIASNLAGIHLYGPYFAESKVGCHAVDGRRSPSPAEYEAYFRSGLVRIATCAAELPGAESFYKAARRRRCLITCGHSEATFSEMARAFAAGMRHVDHFWCAMSSVPSVRQRLGVPMQASMAEFVLLNQAMSTEVIADGCHLAPELLEFAYKLIGPQRLCLVTDCNRALDCPPGRYRFGHQQEGTWFDSDGRVGWAPNGSLASSIQGLDHMVRVMARSTSASLVEVVRMATLTPAERVGIATTTGSLAVGKRADILVLSADLEVRHVIARGRAIPLSTQAAASVKG